MHPSVPDGVYYFISYQVNCYEQNLTLRKKGKIPRIMISYKCVGKFTVSVQLRTRISFVWELHWSHRQATEILSLVFLLVYNIAT